MTSMPTTSELQKGDVVTLSHPKLVQPITLGYKKSGFTLPGLDQSFSADDLRSAGYSVESIERRNTDELRLVGSIQDGQLTVRLQLPSGQERELASVRISNGLNGERSVAITKADFEG